jgi:hypothetical protein
VSIQITTRADNIYAVEGSPRDRDLEEPFKTQGEAELAAALIITCIYFWANSSLETIEDQYNHWSFYTTVKPLRSEIADASLWTSIPRILKLLNGYERELCRIFIIAR